MKDVNKIILVGRLGKDPEKRETKTGRTLANFSLATGRRFRKEGQTEYQNETQWHNLTVWGVQAENCLKYLRKGSLVYAEGSLRSRTYMGKDGNSRTAFDVYVDVINFLSSAGGSPRRADSEAVTSDAGVYEQAS